DQAGPGRPPACRPEAADGRAAESPSPAPRADGASRPASGGRHRALPGRPGEVGHIEWVGPESRELAVYSDRPRLFQRIWAIPGGRKRQTGDQEMRALLEPSALAQVAQAIRARRRRSQTAPGGLRNCDPAGLAGPDSSPRRCPRAAMTWVGA